MSNAEVVPWFCRQEWEFCRDNLYGTDASMKKQALHHLHTWKIRCRNLPVAIECTLILMDTYMQGVQFYEGQNTLLNVMSLELMYSMAITKFVNFVTDSNVGGRVTGTMQDIAGEMGIPSWIVDIRHRAAHSQTVSNLSELREGLDFCLKWLYDNYWSVEDFRDVTQSKDEFGSIRLALEVYVLVKKCSAEGFRSIGDLSPSDRGKLYGFFAENSALNRRNFEIWSLPETCKMIVKKLSRLVRKSNAQAEYLVQLLIEGDEYLLTRSTWSDEDEVTKDTVHKWSEMLSLVCSSNTCFYLLKCLARIAIDDSELYWRKQCAALYVNEVLKNLLIWRLVDPKGIDHSTRKCANPHTFELRRPELSRQGASALLRVSLENPNKFVRIYLKSLISVQEPALPRDKCDKIFALIDIYAGRGGPASNTVPDDPNKQYTVEDLMQSRPEAVMRTSLPDVNMDCNSADEATDVKNTWNKSKGDWNWSEYPLGVLPWQSDFRPWLKMYEDEHDRNEET